MKKIIETVGFYALIGLILWFFITREFEAMFFCIVVNCILGVEKWNLQSSQPLCNKEKNEHDNVVQLDSYRNR